VRARSGGVDIAVEVVLLLQHFEYVHLSVCMRVCV
jgi:hypothetical protein